jgi:hydroxylamine dehydrogenase
MVWKQGMFTMSVNLMRACVLLVVCDVLFAAQAQANFPTVPKETYEALKIDRSASPNIRGRESFCRVNM